MDLNYTQPEIIFKVRKAAMIVNYQWLDFDFFFADNKNQNKKKQTSILKNVTLVYHC